MGRFVQLYSFYSLAHILFLCSNLTGNQPERMWWRAVAIVNLFQSFANYTRRTTFALWGLVCVRVGCEFLHGLVRNLSVSLCCSEFFGMRWSGT